MKPNFKALEFIYQDTEIHFLVSENKNVMINATDMAKAFNKLPADFLRLEQTKAYINEFIKDDDFFYSHYGKSHTENRKNLIVKVTNGGKNKGTYLHRKLALKLAGWLDSKFDYWLSSKIEILMFGNYDLHRQKTIEIQTTKLEIEKLTKTIRNGQFTNAIELLDKQELLQQLKKDKTKAIIHQTKIIQLELF